MKKRLCTHPGKFGDILWSLATARELAKRDNQPVDFAIRPPYHSLIKLLEDQDYIAEVIVIESWKSWGSPFGDQPWNSPPTGRQYAAVTDLGYRRHPTFQLMHYTAMQQGITLPESSVFPFLKIPATVVKDAAVIACGFSPEGTYAASKKQFLESLRIALPEKRFEELNLLPWEQVPARIASSLCFLGCRSALAVCAHGVHATAVIFEPQVARHALWFAPGTSAHEHMVKTVEEAVELIRSLCVS